MRKLTRRSGVIAAATVMAMGVGVALAAWTTSGNRTSALARWAWSSTVRRVTSETKPRAAMAVTATHAPRRITTG